MPRREDERLQDILTSAENIASFLIGQTRESFVFDSLTRSAVLYQLVIVGEAASALSISLRHRYPEIEWSLIVGFRNQVVHAYHNVDWKIVWDTATIDMPELADQIAFVLAKEYPLSDQNEPELPQ
jgi:uncharacterized protein with HEPN domain